VQGGAEAAYGEREPGGVDRPMVECVQRRHHAAKRQLATNFAERRLRWAAPRARQAVCGRGVSRAEFIYYAAFAAVW
jgi:hypothetical protein